MDNRPMETLSKDDAYSALISLYAIRKKLDVEQAGASDGRSLRRAIAYCVRGNQT